MNEQLLTPEEAERLMQLADEQRQEIAGLRAMLHEACDLLNSARCDYGDPQLRRNWGMKRRRILDGEFCEGE